MKIEKMVGEVTKIDVLNFNTASRAFKDCVGMEPVAIKGLCIGETEDEDRPGEMRQCSYIVFADGTISGGVSAVAYKSVKMAMDLFEEMEKNGGILHATFDKGTNKGGDREFVRVVFS